MFFAIWTAGNGQNQGLKTELWNFSFWLLSLVYIMMVTVWQYYPVLSGLFNFHQSDFLHWKQVFINFFYDFSEKKISQI